MQAGYLIFQGIRTYIAKKPYSFVILQGGGGSRPHVPLLETIQQLSYCTSVHLHVWGEIFDVKTKVGLCNKSCNNLVFPCRAWFIPFLSVGLRSNIQSYLIAKENIMSDNDKFSKISNILLLRTSNEMLILWT